MKSVSTDSSRDSSHIAGCPNDPPEEDEAPVELPISRRPLDATSSKAISAKLDPRFGASANDARHFARNYAFLDQVRQDEIQHLERALKKEKEPQRAAQIQLAAKRLKSKLVERDLRNKRLETETRLRAEQAAATASTSTSTSHEQPHEQGSKRKKAFRNVKKSDIKKRLLVDKFHELKQSGRLSKYLERKRKKLLNRDERSLATN